MQLSVPDRLRVLPALAKAGIVAGGYLAAILLAVGVVSIYVSLTNGPDRQNYAAMFAFGDTLLFLAAFGVASLVPTGFALVFLRQSRAFWFACSILALGIAATALAAVVLTLSPAATGGAGESITAWAGLAFPRIFIAPFLAAAFGLSALLAPAPPFRHLLFGAAIIEGAASVFGFIHWFAPLYFH